MSLILAIEPDKRQSGQLATVVNGLHAELVLRSNFADALEALQGRVPDLVLTTSLISPRDDAALAAHLRELGPAAAHVQSVTIPVLGTAAPRPSKGGMLAALRREKTQEPVTDGCTPDLFAEQIRQYLAAAEQQKIAAATRHASGPAPAPRQPEPQPEPEWFAQPEPEFVPEPELEMAAPLEAAPIEPELSAEPPVDEIEGPPVAEAADFVPAEAAGPPLSQLLQFVTDTTVAETPVFDEAAPVVAVEPTVEASPIEEKAVVFAAEPEPLPEPDSVSFADSESAAEPAGHFGDLYVDPMAAQALDELSRQAVPPSLADGIPAEAPVPVVEMHSFQSLDSIASELAAGPSQRYESLDDLASLFAATPTTRAPFAASVRVEPSHDFTAPPRDDTSPFASLFASPAPAPEPSVAAFQPEVDPSLFASAQAAPTIAEARAIPAFAELAFELDTFEPAAVLEAETAPEPEPIFVEPVVEPLAAPVLLVEPDVEAEVEPEPEPLPVVAAAPEPEPEPEFEPEALAAAPSLDEEISLDVDAFVAPPPEPVTPAEPAPFAFTLVDGFGDAWSDFEVPSVEASAADLGLGDHAPMDPYAMLSTPETAGARIEVVEDETPALDAEALSIIGDAARKVSLDAFVIEEFERGLSSPRPKKAAKKKHAGATQVPPAAERSAKPAKRPVQDEWGMFDPEQCGFAALEDEEGAEARPQTGTRVRVISY